MIDFHFHGVPLVIVGTTALNYLSNNKKMRDTIARELRSYLNSKLS
jgi:hypothetical protein